MGYNLLGCAVETTNGYNHEKNISWDTTPQNITKLCIGYIYIYIYVYIYIYIRPSTGLYVCGQHTPTSRHVRFHVAVHVAVHVRDHVKDMAHNKPTYTSIVPKVPDHIL